MTSSESCRSHGVRRRTGWRINTSQAPQVQRGIAETATLWQHMVKEKVEAVLSGIHLQKARNSKQKCRVHARVLAETIGRTVGKKYCKNAKITSIIRRSKGSAICGTAAAMCAQTAQKAPKGAQSRRRYTPVAMHHFCFRTSRDKRRLDLNAAGSLSCTETPTRKGHAK